MLWVAMAKPNASATLISISSGCPSVNQGFGCAGRQAAQYQSFQPRTVSPLSSMGWTPRITQRPGVVPWVQKKNACFPATASGSSFTW